MAKPVLFKKKWQAGVIYGLAAAICFFMFFMSEYLEYSSEQAYFKDRIERITGSNWQPPRVSGNVTPINPTTANSTNGYYIDTSISQDLKDGFITLQSNLDDLENRVQSGEVVTGQSINNQITAFLDNYNPTKNSTINLTVIGSAGAKVTAVCHYKTTDTTYTGTIGTDRRVVIPIKIGTSTSGYQVNIDVTAGDANTRTSFRAQ